MRQIVSEVEQTPDHIWHELLGELTANAFVDLTQVEAEPVLTVV